jgi:aspartyl-tRNA(Asn)/glutamyl-tRNA(Gln) amidotransferase subunit C
MLAIDAAEVRRIAELARIDLDEESIELFSDQLQKILDYVAMLNEVETAAPQPKLRPALPGQAERPDVETASLSPAEALGNSPESDAGMFRVPRVLKPK